MIRKHREPSDPMRIPIDGVVIDGLFAAPPSPRGIVVACSASPHPPDVLDLRALRGRGFATLVVDLLVDAERRDVRRMLDVFLLARRLGAATDAAGRQGDVRDLPIGYLGVGTAAAGTLLASVRDRRVAAVVCHGRPDLAEGVLEQVTVPTLLLADRVDTAGLGLNTAVLASLRCLKQLVVGSISSQTMTTRASSWFHRHLGDGPVAAASAGPRRRDPLAAQPGRPVDRCASRGFRRAWRT